MRIINATTAAATISLATVSHGAIHITGGASTPFVITVTEDITFTMTGEISENTKMRVVIEDAYAFDPVGGSGHVLYGNAVNAGPNLIGDNGLNAPYGFETGIIQFNDLTKRDFVLTFQSGVFTFQTGSTVTFQAGTYTTDVAGLTAPTNYGTRNILLAREFNTYMPTDSQTVELVPEPSHYAVMFAAFTIGVVALRRRKKKQR